MALVREYQSSAIPHEGWEGSIGGGKPPSTPVLLNPPKYRWCHFNFALTYFFMKFFIKLENSP